MSGFDIVYEPRMEDPVVVITLSTRAEADAYMQNLETEKPQTYKYCQIVENG